MATPEKTCPPEGTLKTPESGEPKKKHSKADVSIADASVARYYCVFGCKPMEKTFPSLETLWFHAMADHKGTSNQCMVCHIKFPSWGKANKHLEVKHQIKPDDEDARLKHPEGSKSGSKKKTPSKSKIGLQKKTPDKSKMDSQEKTPNKSVLQKKTPDKVMLETPEKSQDEKVQDEPKGTSNRSKVDSPVKNSSRTKETFPCVFGCVVNNSFASLQDLSNHANTRHKKYSRICSHCNLAFETLVDTLQHVGETHVIKTDREGTCPTPRSGRLRKTSTPGGDRPERFLCTLGCDMKLFRVLSDLSNHSSTAHLNAKDCQLCEVNFESADMVVQHIARSHKVRCAYPHEDYDDDDDEESREQDVAATSTRHRQLYECTYGCKDTEPFESVQDLRRHAQSLHSESTECLQCHIQCFDTDGIVKHTSEAHVMMDAQSLPHTSLDTSPTLLQQEGPSSSLSQSPSKPTHHKAGTSRSSLNVEEHYLCTYGCQMKTFGVISELKEHVQKEHNDTEFQTCLVCGMENTSVEHILMFHKVKVCKFGSPQSQPPMPQHLPDSSTSPVNIESVNNKEAPSTSRMEDPPSVGNNKNNNVSSPAVTSTTTQHEYRCTFGCDNESFVSFKSLLCHTRVRHCLLCQLTFDNFDEARIHAQRVHKTILTTAVPDKLCSDARVLLRKLPTEALEREDISADEGDAFMLENFDVDEMGSSVSGSVAKRKSSLDENCNRLSSPKGRHSYGASSKGRHPSGTSSKGRHLSGASSEGGGDLVINDVSQESAPAKSSQLQTSKSSVPKVNRWASAATVSFFNCATCGLQFINNRQKSEHYRGGVCVAKLMKGKMKNKIGVLMETRGKGPWRRKVKEGASPKTKTMPGGVMTSVKNEPEAATKSQPRSSVKRSSDEAELSISSPSSKTLCKKLATSEVISHNSDEAELLSSPSSKTLSKKPASSEIVSPAKGETDTPSTTKLNSEEAELSSSPSLKTLSKKPASSEVISPAKGETTTPGTSDVSDQHVPSPSSRATPGDSSQIPPSRSNSDSSPSSSPSPSNVSPVKALTRASRTHYEEHFLCPFGCEMTTFPKFEDLTRHAEERHQGDRKCVPCKAQMESFEALLSHTRETHKLWCMVVE